MSQQVKAALDTAPEPFEAAQAGSDAASAMTLTQLNTAVQRALRAQFQHEVWLVGEISGLKARGGDTLYLELIERSDDGPSTARVAAVVFAAAAKRIADTIRRAEADIELVDGVQVCVRARVDLFVQAGRYQVIIEDIDPLHTLGKLAQRREKILSELRQAGIAEQNLAVAEPVLPLRIGLITSVASEAYNDFVNELARSGFGFEVAVAHAPVQGRHVEGAVTEAIARFLAMDTPPDLLAIVRGGGAKTDLAWFDSKAIAEAVCRSPVAVIVGIGHHRDRTVLDEVARSLKTPTAAAGFAIDRVQAALTEINRLSDATERAAAKRLSEANTQVRSAAGRLHREVKHRVQLERQVMKHLRTDLRERSARRARRAGDSLSEARHRLGSATRARLRAERATLDLAFERFGPTRYAATTVRLRQQMRELQGRISWSARSRIRQARERLDALDARRTSLDPANVLRRGFAIVRGPEGKLVSKVGDAKPGDRLDIRLADGHLHVETLEERADR
jgi:exodeoxyribonuclease VII large subunit